MSLSFDSPENMPPGMRKLYEKKLAENNKAQLPKSPMPGLEAEKETKSRKYHNLPTERLLPNGKVLVFDSKKEAAYFDELMVLQAAGVIRDLRLQVQFLLQAAYTSAETGERYRAINYLADFTYDKMEGKKWKHHVVDVKGRRTKDYALKKKLMADMGVYIEEV